MKGLLPRELLNAPDGLVRTWREEAVDDVIHRLVDSGFPCIFARNAQKKHLLRFAFVDGDEPKHLDRLTEDVLAFLDDCRGWDEHVDSAPPLVVLFAPRVTAGARTVREYHDRGWWVLREVHRRDPAPWPPSVPTRPDHAGWSLCFAGVPIFVNMSTPAHKHRRSRNLGRNLAFVVNPRERFDVLAGPTPRGHRARAVIRKRVDAYDDLRHSGDLGFYGSGSLEWHQYEIQDTDPPTHPAHCPFTDRLA
ncbi:MAG: YqcI/YcgG family protein [Dermatophilaceae bacterium]